VSVALLQEVAEVSTESKQTVSSTAAEYTFWGMKVYFDPSTTSAADLVATVEDAGFDGTLISLTLPTAAQETELESNMTYSPHDVTLFNHYLSGGTVHPSVCYGNDVCCMLWCCGESIARCTWSCESKCILNTRVG
jgi:hypothetical protein